MDNRLTLFLGESMSFDWKTMIGISRVKRDIDVLGKLLLPTLRAMYTEAYRQEKQIPERVEVALQNLVPKVLEKAKRQVVLLELRSKADRMRPHLWHAPAVPEFKPLIEERNKLHDRLREIEKEITQTRRKLRLQKFMKVAKEEGIEVTDEELRWLGL